MRLKLGLGSRLRSGWKERRIDCGHEAVFISRDRTRPLPLASPFSLLITSTAVMLATSHASEPTATPLVRANRIFSANGLAWIIAPAFRDDENQGLISIELRLRGPGQAAQPRTMLDRLVQNSSLRCIHVIFPSVQGSLAHSSASRDVVEAYQRSSIMYQRRKTTLQRRCGPRS